jgi:hypothetical protein
MAGIDCIDIIFLQFLDAIIRFLQVIHNGVEFRFLLIYEQVAAKQVAVCSQNPDGTFRVPRKIEYFGIEPVFREVVSFVYGKIGFESLYPEEDIDDFSREKIAFLSVPEHVSAFDHSGIVIVHGDLRAELLTEIGAIAGMVKISMCQNDEIKTARLAAYAVKFLLEFGALGCPPGIDQDKTRTGFYNVAIADYATQVNGLDI